MTDEFPLVSAITLAGKCPNWHIFSVVECFKRQSYPNKELIIVNNAQNQFQASGLIINENNVFIVDTPELLSAGQARNFGLSAANGSIIVQFDSDSWHHDDRIGLQVAAMAANEAHVCLLARTMKYSYISGMASIWHNHRNGILNTMAFVRSDAIYNDIEKNEEFSLLQKMPEAKTISIDLPWLICKFIHTLHEPCLKPKNKSFEFFDNIHNCIESNIKFRESVCI